MVDRDSKYRILIVEDSMFNQFVLQNILEDSYTIAKAATAAEAWKLIPEFHPHLILLDIILPDASGFDILAVLKAGEETHLIPVIIITGLNSDKDEERGFFLGAVDYIKRPFKNAIVRARVDTQIHIVRQMQTIERLGMIDGLTEISNRRAFNVRIQYEWKRAIRERSELAMIMVDIDHFKNYNDRYGHPQGDIMLRAVSRAMEKALKRSTDLLFRYGGEEFSVLLPNTNLKGAGKVAERMRKNVEQTKVRCIGKQEITTETISIGIAAIRPKTADQITEFVEKVDRALYRAKNNGRNQIQFA